MMFEINAYFTTLSTGGKQEPHYLKNCTNYLKQLDLAKFWQICSEICAIFYFMTVQNQGIWKFDTPY